MGKSKGKLRLWKVEFKPLWPIGGCLILLAHDKEEADEIAGNTIIHTKEFTTEEVPMKQPSVVMYMNGDY